MADQVATRPSVELANIDALRDAYTKMQALPGDDNRSWIYWAGYHGYPNWYCWHHSKIGNGATAFSYNLFLPWHRAYLVYWDNVVRDQNADAVQPWWDWTQTSGVPDAYTQDIGNGDANPLISGPTPDMPDDPARRTRRFPGSPPPDSDQQLPPLPTTDDVDTLLALSTFEDLSAQLEQLHDNVHVWTGGTSPDDPNVSGDMANVPSAAYDPIFWAHHTMIDRLWYLWQVRYGVNTIPGNYLNQVLAPFGYTVAQVLDTTHLGYDYASSAASAPAASAGSGSDDSSGAAGAGDPADASTDDGPGGG